MKKEVKHKSIREVLRKGHLYINGLVMLIMILIWFVSIFLAYQIVPGEYSTMTIFIGLVLGFIAGWLYWSVAITKWRIWAFENVDKRNWKELKHKAIREKLIWPDNSIYNKTELRTEKQKELINKIQEKIPNGEKELTLDEIQDDENLPDKTDYYFAKSEIILNPILLLAFITGGIFLFSQNREVFAAISVIVGIYNFNLKLFKNLFNRKKQMSISNKGIEMNLKDFGFIKWSDTNNIVMDEETGVLRLDAIKNNELYNLTYNVGSFERKDREDLLRRINIYLKRNQIKNGS